MKTPEEKFEGHWRFLEPEVRRLFFQMFKEGIVYATASQEDRLDELIELMDMANSAIKESQKK